RAEGDRHRRGGQHPGGGDPPRQVPGGRHRERGHRLSRHLRPLRAALRPAGGDAQAGQGRRSAAEAKGRWRRRRGTQGRSQGASQGRRSGQGADGGQPRRGAAGLRADEGGLGALPASGGGPRRLEQVSGEPQLELFGPAPGVAAEPAGEPPGPAPASEALRALGTALPSAVRLGASSWSFPGWTGLVSAREASADVLAREGLPAYARHPLFRVVGVDRTFYGPVTAEVFRGWAEAVPPDFRFLVKAHEALTLPRFPRHERYGARRGGGNPPLLHAPHPDPGAASPPPPRPR